MNLLNKLLFGFVYTHTKVIFHYQSILLCIFENFTFYFPSWLTKIFLLTLYYNLHDFYEYLWFILFACIQAWFCGCFFILKYIYLLQFIYYFLDHCILAKNEIAGKHK